MTTHYSREHGVFEIFASVRRNHLKLILDWETFNFWLHYRGDFTRHSPYVLFSSAKFIAKVHPQTALLRFRSAIVHIYGKINRNHAQYFYRRLIPICVWVLTGSTRCGCWDMQNVKKRVRHAVEFFSRLTDKRNNNRFWSIIDCNQTSPVSLGPSLTGNHWESTLDRKVGARQGSIVHLKREKIRDHAVPVVQRRTAFPSENAASSPAWFWNVTATNHRYGSWQPQ